MVRFSFLCVVIPAILFQYASAQSAARGRALCIGLNEVDPGHYGSPLRLSGCRNDAQDLATILRGVDGFDPPDVLLDSQATVAAVENEIRSAASELNAGDLFVLTIASHGSQLPDLNGDEAELDSTDRLDETWLLYDRMWVDDERYGLWHEFESGVRILIVADTCHSGTTIRRLVTGSGSAQIFLNGVKLGSGSAFAAAAGLRDMDALLRSGTSMQSDDAFHGALSVAKTRAAAFPIRAAAPDGGGGGGVGRGDIRNRGLGWEVGANTRSIAEISQTVRTIDRNDAIALYAARSNVYDPILQRDAVNERSPLNATIVLLAACQDHQTAADGNQNGAFTGTLKEVWAEEFAGTYEGFVNEIKRRMYNRFFEQTPNYLPLGAPDPEFLYKAQRPFSVRL